MKRALVLSLALAGCGEDEPVVVRAPADSGALASPKDAPDLDPAPNVVRTRLRAAETVHVVGDGSHAGYAYSGELPGPTLRGRVGDTLVVELENDLDLPTTVHWHGLRAPYAMDGALRGEPILPGASFTYEIPLEQPGTFWYHPHFDASSQLDLGLYGAVVVEDPDEPSTDHELVLIFDRWFESASPVTPSHPHALEPAHAGDPEKPAAPGAGYWTVNGRVEPRAELPSGSRVRARLVNASTTDYLDLRWSSAVTIIAGDQGLLAEPAVSDALLLAPGDRAEVELLLGEPDLVLEAAPYSDGGGPTLWEPELLATITTEGSSPAPAPSAWPFSNASATLEPTWADVVWVLSGDYHTSDWRMNGEVFPDVTPQELSLGNDIVLELRNLSATEHPFYLQGHRFEVLSTDGAQPAKRRIEDTLNVRIGETVRLLVHPDNPGDWPAHCQVQAHAEAGMMTLVSVH